MGGLIDAAASGANMSNKPGGGINIARGANRQKRTTPVQGTVNAFHLQRHFAEPHHMRPEPAVGAAITATVVTAKIAIPDRDATAVLTPHL